MQNSRETQVNVAPCGLWFSMNCDVLRAGMPIPRHDSCPRDDVHLLTFVLLPNWLLHWMLQEIPDFLLWKNNYKKRHKVNIIAQIQGSIINFGL